MHPINGISINYNYNGWCGSISRSLPYQGWKIHISAVFENYQTVLNHVAFLSKKFNFSFKYASTEALIDSLLGIHSNRISGGKLITLYPQTEKNCRQLLYILYRYLKSFHGPIILSDAQFKNTTNISYRYGVFVGHQGKNYLYYNGKKYLDKKVPYFLLPPFIPTDPFAENKYTPIKDSQWNNITIDNAVQFSFGGGIYLGRYLNKYRIVVKEARYGVGDKTSTAIDKRKNEYHILSTLNGKYFPKCLNFFYSQSNYYLITEAISGKTLYDYFSSVGPAVVSNISKPQAMINFIDIINQISDLISYAHDKDIILRDIKPSNFVITDINTVFFIDCADSIIDKENSYSDQVKTPGYTIPNSLYNTFAEDWFKLALLIIDALSGINRNSPPANFKQICLMFYKALNIQGFSKTWAEIITALSQNNVQKFNLLLKDQQLYTVVTQHKNEFFSKKVTLDNILIHKRFISNWLYRSLSSSDQHLFDQLDKCEQYEVVEKLDKLLKSFTIRNELTYRKTKNTYSPYVYNGTAGLAYIILYFCDKYDLLSQLESLKHFLITLKGRYVKSSSIATGAAGISLLLLYSGIVTNSTTFLQLALSWNEYIDVLSFNVKGKEIWCNGEFSSSTSRIYNNAQEIQQFKQLIHDIDSHT